MHKKFIASSYPQTIDMTTLEYSFCVSWSEYTKEGEYVYENDFIWRRNSKCNYVCSA